MSTGSCCSSSSADTADTEDTAEEDDTENSVDTYEASPDEEVYRHKLHRHDIISYKNDDEGEEEDNKEREKEQELTKRKLSRNLSDHLYWKKKENKARLLRSELEREMESEQWISALSICKKILDLCAFNFEPLYHFYCGFIYETGFNNYESAERHYRVALQLEQSNDKHIRYYARILRRLERYSQSESVYEYGLEQHRNNEFIRYEYSYLLWIAQKYEKAIYHLRQCLKDKECGENVYWLYGRIQSEMEEYDAARQYLNRAIHLKPDDIGYRVDYILYLMSTKKYKEALKYYQSMESMDDDSDDTFCYIYLQSVYGYLLSLMKKTKRAQSVFDELIAQHNNNYFEIHLFNGLHLLFNLKQFNDALFQFLSALIIEDNWGITYYYISLVLYELNEYHSCLDFLNLAFKMNASIPMIRNGYPLMMTKLRKRLQFESEQREEDIHHLAVKEYKKRNWSFACVLFLRLLQINAENTNYQHNLAMVLFYGFDNNESSEKYFRRSLKQCGSSHPDIIRHYNVLLINQKRFEEAHAYFHILFKIINKNKTTMALSVDDHIQYAIVAMSDELKLYHESKQHLKIALKQRPNDAHIIAKYAMLLKLLNTYSLAKEYFKHALSFIAKDIEIRYEYSNLLWMMQDYKASCNELKICLNVINAKTERKRKRKRKENIAVMEEKCCILYGIILIEMEEYHAAKQFILRSIELNYDIRYIAELMLLLIKCEEYDDAIKYYVSAKQRTATDNTIDPWYLESAYAVYCSQTNDLNEARKAFTLLLEDGSPCYFIHFFYAKHLHYKEDKYAMAKEQYIKAISIEDNWAITYWHFGICLFQLKEYKSAQTFIKKAFETNQQIPVITTNYQKQLHEIDNAMQIIERSQYESDKALKLQKRSQMEARDNDLKNVKNALGINKKTKKKKTKKKHKRKHKHKHKMNKSNRNRRRRRKSNLYGSNSNLLEESSLDNLDHLHKNRERNNNKKRRANTKGNKLTKDSHKLYKDRYHAMDEIKQKQNNRNKLGSKHNTKHKHKSISPQSHSSNSMTMISASIEYSNDNQSVENQSSTNSY